MRCLTCPKCMEPPGIAIGTQWFCGNNDCEMLMWNPTISADENLAQATTINLNEGNK